MVISSSLAYYKRFYLNVNIELGKITHGYPHPLDIFGIWFVFHCLSTYCCIFHLQLSSNFLCCWVHNPILNIKMELGSVSIFELSSMFLFCHQSFCNKWLPIVVISHADLFLTKDIVPSRYSLSLFSNGAPTSSNSKTTLQV